MLKKNKWSAIISSFVILLPAILGLIFWDHLPEQMVTHWGPDGTPDGIMGKVAAVAVLPAILLAVHWLCLLITAWDWKKNPQGRKVEKRCNNYQCHKADRFFLDDGRKRKQKNAHRHALFRRRKVEHVKQ